MDRKNVLMMMLFLLMILSFNSMALGLEAVPHEVKRKLIVGVTSEPPFSIQDEDGTWSGITVDLWKEIAKIIDVDYEFRNMENEEAVWNGLDKGTLDVGAAPLSVTSSTAERFDLTNAYLPSIESVAVSIDQQPNLLQLFRSTFQNWGCLGIIVLIIILTILGAAVLWLLEHKGDSEHYSGKTGSAFARSLVWSTMVLSGRDFPKPIGWAIFAPSTTAGRMFGMVWMMVGIVISMLFTATIASVLTTKQLQGTIHRVDDLRRVAVATVAPSVLYDFLRDQNIRCNHLYKRVDEMLDALAEHKCDAAVWGRVDMLYFARTRYVNKIAVLNLPLRQDFLAIPLRKGSHLTGTVNRAMLRIVESKKWIKILRTYLGDDWAG
jgi:polar amino acid transport system substrate-binding protein